MTKDIINQLGENREEYFNAAIPPIFSNSNFLFSKVEDMRSAMINKNDIPFYTRGHNPTTRIFENPEDVGIFTFCNKSFVLFS